MKTQFKIIAAFAIVFLVSFIPEYCHSLFGDWYCLGSGEELKDGGVYIHYQYCNYAAIGYHNPEWHWGFRHYIWLLCGIVLFIYNIVTIIKIHPND
jgi:hypothetical protein